MKKPINVIVVLCDPSKMQRIALTCRCGHRWTEVIPQELHDSDMIAQFECPKDSTIYHLHHKQLHRSQGGNYDRTSEVTRFAVDNKQQYDS